MRKEQKETQPVENLLILFIYSFFNTFSIISIRILSPLISCSRTEPQVKTQQWPSFDWIIFIHPSVLLSVHPSVHSSVHPSFCRSIRRSIHPSIHPKCWGCWSLYLTVLIEGGVQLFNSLIETFCSSIYCICQTFPQRRFQHLSKRPNDLRGNIFSKNTSLKKHFVLKQKEWSSSSFVEAGSNPFSIGSRSVRFSCTVNDLNSGHSGHIALLLVVGHLTLFDAIHTTFCRGLWDTEKRSF